MMHYSNWLIAVKNRACIRNGNAWKTPKRDSEWDNRRHRVVDTQKKTPGHRKVSELAVGVSLWKKGEYNII